MKKEKKVRTYQRRTKTGKLVTVKQHTAKYDAAEKAKEMLKKKGAGDELSAKKKAKPVSSAGELDFSQADFKAWYHWDQENDPKNPTALKVEKALKAKMGAKGYRKFFNDMSDSYSARGHLKAYKECSACGDKSESKSKSKSVEAKVKTPKDATPKEERTPSKITAHAHGNTKTRWDVTPTSAMLKDVKLTKMLDGDAYEETFPKGGSYEFFIGEHKKAGKTHTGVYVKSGKDVTYLDDGEEILPASFLKKLKASKPGVTKENPVKRNPKTSPKSSEKTTSEKDYSDKVKQAHASLKEKGYKKYAFMGKVYWATKSGTLKQVSPEGKIISRAPFTGAKMSQVEALKSHIAREKKKAKEAKDRAELKELRAEKRASWMKESPIKLKQEGSRVIGEYSQKGQEPWRVQVNRDRKGNFRVMAIQRLTGNTRKFEVSTLKNLDKHLKQEISPRRKMTSKLGADGEMSYGSKVITSKALGKERVK